MKDHNIKNSSGFEPRINVILFIASRIGNTLFREVYLYSRKNKEYSENSTYCKNKDIFEFRKSNGIQIQAWRIHIC